MIVVRGVIALIATVLLMTFLTPSSYAEEGTRYVTFGDGRASYSEGVNCRVAPGAVTIMEVAEFGASLPNPMSISPNAIPEWHDDAVGTELNDRPCKAGGRHIHMSWRDLAVNRDVYDGKALTSGMGYRVMTDPDTNLNYEMCVALERMRARGHYSAAGMIAPPAPGDRPGVDDDVVRVARNCGYVFIRDYGRYTYNLSDSNVLGKLHEDGHYRVISVNGGSCPDIWDCTASARTYANVEHLANVLRNAPRNSHTLIQFYRIVDEDVPGKWKCSGPSETHKTYATELFCEDDLYKLFRVASNQGLVSSHPLAVAKAWGLR